MRIEQVIAEYRGGMSVTKLALRNGVSPKMMRRRLEVAGVDTTARQHVNDTRSRDARIKRMLADKRPQREIARQIGCTLATIRKVKAAQ